MAASKTIHVYADWLGLNGPVLLGVLTAASIRGKEIFSFAYDEAWLRSGHSYILDPSLQLFSGLQYNPDDKPNFGLFLDSSPDRWGHTLMKRKEVITARQANCKPVTLLESDFLLGVYDEHRMGGLRFKTDPQGPFLNADEKLSVPPWASLRKLENASLQLEAEEKTDDETWQWLQLLLAPGSSLGGARPKASVKSPEGHLWLAKFSSGRDEHDVGGWEMVAFRLAGDAGLRMSAATAKKFTSRHHTFLAKRFDRTADNKRVHFASAMTLLGYNDGADFHTGASYLELAEFIVQNGSNVAADLRTLETDCVQHLH